MRVITIMASYNEERYIAGCLEHLFEQGVEVYLIDNDSTDRTVEIAERYQGHGLIEIETFPREDDTYKWGAILERKEELAATLEADWFMHADPDEIRLPPSPDKTLAEAFVEVDERGYNAANFMEFTFVPTREAPDHDHADFLQTIKHYYPFVRNFPYQIKAWKRQPERVELARSGGHKVRFPDQRLYPESFRMKHYPYLSVQHVISKYIEKKYDTSELEKGWHSFRPRVRKEKIELPSQAELNLYTTDDALDISNPRMQHVMQNWTSSPTNGQDSSSISDAAKESPPPPRNALPIVVGGCPCSGTSLVQQMLDTHSRVYCGPEVTFFRDFHNDYLNDPIEHARFMTSARRMLPDPQLLNILGKTFVSLHEKAARQAEKARWADNNPENVIYLRDWKALLGDDWLLVHVVCNPLDTLASLKEVDFPRVIPRALNARIKLYKTYTRAGLRFEKRNPERYYRVIYEELVEQPERVISELMGWLGEEIEPAQLDFNSADRSKALSAPKALDTSEEYMYGVGRWKKVLASQEAKQISQQCDQLWRRVAGHTVTESPSKWSLLHRL